MSTDTRQALAARDTSKPAEQQGLFDKFKVLRRDGSSEPGEKHDGCEYFVLDIDHDPHAKAALAAYADDVEATHPLLAKDMRARYGLAAQPVAGAVAWISEDGCPLTHHKEGQRGDPCRPLVYGDAAPAPEPSKCHVCGATEWPCGEIDCPGRCRKPLAPEPSAQGEPVLSRNMLIGGLVSKWSGNDDVKASDFLDWIMAQPLAASPKPQQAVPLTDEQILMDGAMMVPNTVTDYVEWFTRGVRFAERMRGIAPKAAQP